MKHELAPTGLEVRAFARASGALAGRDPMHRYERILEECQGRGQDNVVAWSARGELRADPSGLEQIWLHLHAEVVAPLTCQRCLDTVEVPLLVDRSFRFEADEATAAAQDEEAVEDLLVLESDFNLHQLIEDELVLELPMIAVHEFCPRQPSLSAEDASFGVAVAGRTNPFAALAHLKSGRNSEK